MVLTAEQANAVKRITTRLRSADEATYRAGGRAVALQAIEHRVDLVHALRSAIAELGEVALGDRQRGYQEALLDVLVAAEAALEPREREVRARRELASTPVLQQVLDLIAPTPVTPGEVAKKIGKSAASAGRYFLQLRSLGLIGEMPSTSDARERPHRVTPLGARLTQPLAFAAPDRGRMPVTVMHVPVVSASEQVRVRYLEFGSAVRLENDPATGLRLWTVFHQLLASQLEIHRKASLPLTIMRVDIRDFHEFTAHADFTVVNQFIIQVAETLKRELAVPAEVARYDWDKFVVMLPQRPVEDAKKVAKVLLSKLDPVTANIGIAGADAKKPVDIDTLLRASDAALQQAKAEGLTFATEVPVSA